MKKPVTPPAPLDAALLLRALAPSGEDAVNDILAAVVTDLDVCARLAEATEQRSLSCTIDGVARRLRLAIALRRREQGATVEPADVD